MPTHAYTHFNFWRDLLAAHNNYAFLDFLWIILIYSIKPYAAEFREYLHEYLTEVISPMFFHLHFQHTVSWRSWNGGVFFHPQTSRGSAMTDVPQNQDSASLLLWTARLVLWIFYLLRDNDVAHFEKPQLRVVRHHMNSSDTLAPLFGSSCFLERSPQSRSILFLKRLAWLRHSVSTDFSSLLFSEPSSWFLHLYRWEDINRFLLF